MKYELYCVTACGNNLWTEECGKYDIQIRTIDLLEKDRGGFVVVYKLKKVYSGTHRNSYQRHYERTYQLDSAGCLRLSDKPINAPRDLSYC